MTKHVFVTGGVVSSLGKGITAASLGRLLVAWLQSNDAEGRPVSERRPRYHEPLPAWWRSSLPRMVTSPDLDLGHYERFIDENLTRDSNFTTGAIYKSLIARERRGDFGGTVQVIPHVTNAIKDKFRRIEEQTGSDVVITELAAMIGDIESQPFVEAIRQYRKGGRPPRTSATSTCRFVPYIAAAHEVKTKPTQHSVKELRSLWYPARYHRAAPDHHIDDAIRGKIASFCDVDTDCVFTNEDCASIYDVPQLLAEQDFDPRICERLSDPERDMSEWNEFLRKQNHANHHADKVKIAVVGETSHAARCVPVGYRGSAPCGRLLRSPCGRPAGRWRDPRRAEIVSEVLGDASGILVPGGFGKRALEGKRSSRPSLPVSTRFRILGICLGMQVALCEFARNVVGLCRRQLLRVRSGRPV